MIKKWFQNLAEKAGTGYLLLNPDKISLLFFYLLFLFLPTQFGKHFWPEFSFVYGLRLDYLSPTIYLTDILTIIIFVFSIKSVFRLAQRFDKKYFLVYLLFLIGIFLDLPYSKNPFALTYASFKLIEMS